MSEDSQINAIKLFLCWKKLFAIKNGYTYYLLEKRFEKPGSTQAKFGPYLGMLQKNPFNRIGSVIKFLLIKLADLRNSFKQNRLLVKVQ